MQPKGNHSPKKLIIIVDRGNISRGPIAKAILKKTINEKGEQGNFIVESMRTQGIASDDPEPVTYPNLSYYPEYERSKRWLDNHGIHLSNRYSTGINPWQAEKASVIFAMDAKTQTSLSAMFPEYEGKIHLLSEIIGKNTDIKDPESVQDEQTLGKIYDEIERTIIDGFDELLKLAEGTSDNNTEGVSLGDPEKL